jgi:hypothetical protein
MNKKLIYALVLSMLTLTFSATMVFAATKSYYGVTTVTYNNRIVDGGASGWNGGFKDATGNPSTPWHKRVFSGIA